jgi:cell division septal protein FtsQ
MTAVTEQNQENNRNHRDNRRRGVTRTALILGAVVAFVYLAFIGRAALNYFGS